jgi:hypothetical protein
VERRAPGTEFRIDIDETRMLAGSTGSPPGAVEPRHTCMEEAPDRAEVRRSSPRSRDVAWLGDPDATGRASCRADLDEQNA